VVWVRAMGHPLAEGNAGYFEREWMPQGACPGREAPTPILDQALSQRDGIERVLDELRERDDVEGAEVSRAEDHRRRDPCDERLAPS